MPGRTDDVRFRFGAFELDPRSRELRDGVRRQRIQEQPFEILRVLLERPGQVITRDELRQHLWPDGTFVDFEHSLNAAIKRLRAVLGDDADNPRFVETVPRAGVPLHRAGLHGQCHHASPAAHEDRPPVSPTSTRGPAVREPRPGPRRPVLQ
jgi:DNA-binding winged helix-turn-helix (wHTH) protein